MACKQGPCSRENKPESSAAFSEQLRESIASLFPGATVKVVDAPEDIKQFLKGTGKLAVNEQPEAPKTQAKKAKLDEKRDNMSDLIDMVEAALSRKDKEREDVNRQIVPSPHLEALRRRSGNVYTRNPLVVFLYDLMRDYVLPGDIESIMMALAPDGGVVDFMREVSAFLEPDALQNLLQATAGEKTVIFCNGYLAQYAVDVAKRLTR